MDVNKKLKKISERSMKKNNDEMETCGENKTSKKKKIIIIS